MRIVDIGSESECVKNAALLINFETRTLCSTKVTTMLSLIDYTKGENPMLKWSAEQPTVAILENDKAERLQGLSPSPWHNTPTNNPFKKIKCEAEFIDTGISF